MTNQVNAQTVAPEEKQDEKAYNFEQLRKKLESTEREKQALQNKATAYEKEIVEINKKKLRQPEPEEDVYDEPYVDERRLNKRFEKFEQRVNEVAEQKARTLIEQERQTAFLKQNADFNQIMTADVVQKFADKHPEIAEPMLEMPEGFARQKLLYQAIKMSGINKPPEPKPSIQDTINAKRQGAFYQPPSMGTPPYLPQGDCSESGQKNAYEKIQSLKKQLRI